MQGWPEACRDWDMALALSRRSEPAKISGSPSPAKAGEGKEGNYPVEVTGIMWRGRNGLSSLALRLQSGPRSTTWPIRPANRSLFSPLPRNPYFFGAAHSLDRFASSRVKGTKLMPPTTVSPSIWAPMSSRSGLNPIVRAAPKNLP